MDVCWFKNKTFPCQTDPQSRVSLAAAVGANQHSVLVRSTDPTNRSEKVQIHFGTSLERCSIVVNHFGFNLCSRSRRHVRRAHDHHSRGAFKRRAPRGSPSHSSHPHPPFRSTTSAGEMHFEIFFHSRSIFIKLCDLFLKRDFFYTVM